MSKVTYILGAGGILFFSAQKDLFQPFAYGKHR